MVREAARLEGVSIVRLSVRTLILTAGRTGQRRKSCLDGLAPKHMLHLESPNSYGSFAPFSYSRRSPPSQRIPAIPASAHAAFDAHGPLNDSENPRLCTALLRVMQQALSVFDDVTMPSSVHRSQADPSSMRSSTNRPHNENTNRSRVTPSPNIPPHARNCRTLVPNRFF